MINARIDGVDRKLDFIELDDARVWALAYLRENPHVQSVQLWRPWRDGPNGREVLALYVR